MHALIVADQPELSQALDDALRETGFATTRCNTVTAAVEAFAADPPPLIIATWRLSELDGVALCRALRTHEPQHRCLVLLVTDRTSPADWQHILAAGADDYLLSPLDPAQLQIRLRIAARLVRDRADWARAEHQLRESMERFELAVRGANDGLWDARPMGQPWHSPDTKVWFSPRLKELLGFQDDEFPNVLESWESRLHPEDYDRVMQAVVAHIERKQPYDVEYRLRTKTGVYRWFSARGQAIWDEQDRMLRMSGSMRDITQTKEYEAKLQQSEAKWRSLVENAPDIIVLADIDGKMRFINRTTEFAAAAIGHTAYEYVESPYQEMLREAFGAVSRSGTSQQLELQSQNVDGTGKVWYSSRLGPIWHNGQIESIVLIATDITHRKIVEAQLERGRKMLQRLLDLQERERQLVAYDLHDGLVQYLTGGLMHMESFAAASSSTNPRAQSEYERGMGLLRDALAEARRLISGLRPPILDELGVVSALEYLVNETRQSIPQVVFANHSHLGRLAAPLEVAIFRITQEALSNIRRHSNAQRARVELLHHGEWVRLMIRDWGCGFDPAQVPEDRFGLQGIRQRARLLGTRATIESTLGQGTIIVVDFPIVRDESSTDQ